MLRTCLLVSILCTSVSAAASENTHEHDHNQAGYPTHDHTLELGVSPGLVYLPAEDTFTAGLHMHLLASLGASRWSVGVGLERLFDQHAHNTLGFVAQYRIWDTWGIAIGPGLTFTDEDPTALEPSLHIETMYEFVLADFHVGPSVEFAADPEEIHLTLGLHFGVGF